MSLETLQTIPKNAQKRNPSKCNKFRICGRKIFITYSQLDPKMTAEHVLEQLQNKYYPLYYIISKESHQDQGIHFHVLLINKNKFDIQNAK